MKTIYKRWSNKKTLGFMKRNWARYKGRGATQRISEMSGWCDRYIRAWRCELGLPDNRLKHEEKNSKTKNRRIPS